jgi:HAD superfamily hydrolase (TIGR01548 family)
MVSLSPGVIVFDMDGVLLDVSDSYRETVAQTVEHFTGKRISREEIQEYKNRGGFNNDWLICHTHCAKEGVEVGYQEVVDYFNHLFFEAGLINRERWLPRSGFIERLAANYTLAIFTGRNMLEATTTLDREGFRHHFFLVTVDDLEHDKPHPEGLLKIAARHPGQELLYIGDTIDDARAARAAGVNFIGIAGHENPGRDKLAHLLEAEGALVVLDNINDLEEVLCAPRR